MSTLTAKNRCDACHVAAAYVRVTLPFGEFELCGHHYTRHENTLRGHYPTMTVVDERDRLTVESEGAKGDEVR